MGRRPGPIRPPLLMGGSMAELDTEGAIADLELADSYLKDFSNDPNMRFLSLASQNIVSARQKDPTARMTFFIDKKAFFYTADELAGRALWYEARHYTRPRQAPRQDLEKAEALLRQGLQYDPLNIGLYEALAEVYLRLNRKKDAQAVAARMLEKYPNYVEARKLVDRVAVARATKPATVFHRNPEGMRNLGVAMIIGAVALAIFSDTATALAAILGVGGALIAGKAIISS